MPIDVQSWAVPTMGQQGKDGDGEDSLGNARKRDPCGPYSVTEAPLCVSQELLQSLPQSPVSQAVCIMNYPKGFSLEELKITFTVCACALPSPSADLTTCKGSAWVVPGCAYLKNNRCLHPAACAQSSFSRWSLGIAYTWGVGVPSGQSLNKALTGVSTPQPRDSDKHTAIYFA